MKCSNCGHDLMVGLVPKGLGRFLPLTSYNCVRCGKVNMRFSGILAAYSPQALLVPLLILAMGTVIWLVLFAPQPQEANSVRQEIASTTEQTAPLDQPPAATDLSSTGAPADAASQTAPQASPEHPPATPGIPGEAASTSPGGIGELPDSATAAGPAIPGSMPEPTLKGAAQQATAPAAKATSPAVSAKPALEEIAVVAPPKNAPPTVAPTGKKNKQSASGSPTLLGVRSGIWKDALVMNLDVKGLPGEPTGFQMTSPPRYVVDIPGKWTYAGAKQVSVAKGGVKTIRLGVHEDKLRIVLDLERDPKQASARRTPDGLTITIR